MLCPAPHPLPSRTRRMKARGLRSREGGEEMGVRRRATCWWWLAVAALATRRERHGAAACSPTSPASTAAWGAHSGPGHRGAPPFRLSRPRGQPKALVASLSAAAAATATGGGGRPDAVQSMGSPSLGSPSLGLRQQLHAACRTLFHLASTRGCPRL